MINLWTGTAVSRAVNDRNVNHFFVSEYGEETEEYFYIVHKNSCKN